MRITEKNAPPGAVPWVTMWTALECSLGESESQENLFINRWFAQVKKNVVFKVTWPPMLNRGRTLGVRTRLRHNLDNLWRSCSGERSEQNDLFRSAER